MNVRNSFDSIESIELEIASTKALAKSVIARMIFALQLELCRKATPIIHIVRSISCGPDVEGMLGVFIALTIFYVKLRLLHVLLVL